MSLRTRLFVLLSGTLALLMGAQWWLIGSLAEDLDSEVGMVALSVGRQVVETLEEVRVQVRAPEDEAIGDMPERPPEDKTEAEKDVTEIHIEARLVDREERVSKKIVRVIHPEGNETLEKPDLSELAVRELGGLSTQDHLRDVRVFPLGGGSRGTLVLKGPSVNRRVPIPFESLEERLQAFRKRLLAGTLTLLACGLLLAAAVAHQVSKPLRGLIIAARRVGDGELGVQATEVVGGEVGETVRAFNQMSRRLAQLENASRRLRGAQHLSELGEVSRGFAHSLRNPLNAIGLTIDTLAEGHVEETLRHRLAATARQQIRRVDGALRSFLALSNRRGVREDVAIAPLLQDVVLEALQGVLGGAGGKTAPQVELRTGPDDLNLLGVQPEIRAAIQALVVNAVEASPEGGRISVEAQDLGDGRIRIFVGDEGPGLPPEVRERLFTPHVTTKAHGSGMGLFLAHRIAVNRYDGELRIEEIQPTGTRAILELGPRSAEHEADDVGGIEHG